ncbi:unnamed protein product [Moneuplotes crassus]|uniref:EF-hand domain-containing protein n=1 Tax=Euplotes crassus TaxID=5936 RepID=A0AAD2DBY1_EUPCR|nr:unnamed protein product [Moneuplotes crassus]
MSFKRQSRRSNTSQNLLENKLDSLAKATEKVPLNGDLSLEPYLKGSTRNESKQTKGNYQAEQEYNGYNNPNFLKMGNQFYNTEGKARFRVREELNNSSPNKKPHQGQGQPLVDEETIELRRKTYQFFKPSPDNYSLDKNFSSQFKTQPRRVEEHARENDGITEYTKEEMAGFKTVFNTFDKTNKGEVSLTDLGSIFQSFGRNPDELPIILREFGLNNLHGKGKIKFNLFVKIMQRLETEIDKTHDDIDQDLSIQSKTFHQRPHNDLSSTDYEHDIYASHYTSGDYGQDEPIHPEYEVFEQTQKHFKNNDIEEIYTPEPEPELQEQAHKDFESEEKPLEGNIKFYHEIPTQNVKPRLRSKSVAEGVSWKSSYQPPRSPTEKERKLYGTMLPKTGVYFLPDLRVIDQIKTLTNYKKQYLKEGKLMEAKKSKKKISELRSKEMIKQLTNMCISHEKEVKEVKKAQKKQFEHFQGNLPLILIESWDSFMEDYEQSAQESIGNAQKDQKKEVKELEDIMNNNPTFKVTLSQDLILLRNKINKLISLGKYEEANHLREKAEEQEKIEYTKAAIESDLDVDKNKVKLNFTHQKTIRAMLLRIERDRREQDKHRKEDTQRLVQRNKNLLKSISTRQAQEKRKTKQFLSWALGDISKFKNHKSTIEDSHISRVVAPRDRESRAISQARICGISTIKSKFNTLMKNRNSLPLVRHNRASKSEAKVPIKRKLKSTIIGNFKRSIKHKAVGRHPRRHYQNLSSNNAYGMFERTGPFEEYSSFL